MSIHRSYFNKNNTIISNSLTNTGRNPVTQLFYGRSTSKCVYTGYSGDTCGNKFYCRETGYSGDTCDGLTGFTKTGPGDTGFTKTFSNNHSRYIFDIDLSDLRVKVNNCCVTASALTHTLKMTNTSNFDDALINSKVLMNDTRRATSFELQLFKVTGYTWSEGVGYDYQVPHASLEPQYNTTQSNRPSNWTFSDTVTNWLVPGTYDNTQFPSPTTYTVLATQRFDHGDENISFSNVLLDNEINTRLDSPSVSDTIYGIAYIPPIEQVTGLTESYSVGFFSRHTQTFYEPFLETSINDIIRDDRGNFNLSCSNRLFLYVYDCDGNPICLDKCLNTGYSGDTCDGVTGFTRNHPTVAIIDCLGATVATLTATSLTCGAYYVDYSITNIPQTAPVQYEDVWSNILINGLFQTPITNEFIINDNGYTIGTTVIEPKVYGYSVSGIREDEKIKNGDKRKIYVSAREPYTTNKSALVNNIQYRLYVREGNTQVEVIPWTMINMSFTDNYFLLDTSWMIPNEYHLDIKSTSNQQVDTYSKVIKFQIVNEK